MTLHSFHLAEVPRRTGVRVLLRLPGGESVPGLRHAECLALMTLGAPTFSPQRMQLERVAVFAEWSDSDALDRFLGVDPFGRQLAGGWHVRLQFLRRWGAVREFAGLACSGDEGSPDEPVVAVTLARMRLTQLPRFLTWGKPVERQVRDDPAVSLAVAGMRPPQTVATFSVWSSMRQMTEMVRGRGAGADPDRHRAAMAERDRKDFHHEFTTLRFRPLSEHGQWQGRRLIVPGAGPANL